MDLISTIVLPIFGIIGIGYLIAWSRLVSSQASDAIAAFVLAVPIPALIFKGITDGEISTGVLPTLLWTVYLAGLAAIWTAGAFAMYGVFHRDPKTSAVGGIAAAFGNVFMLGIPLVVATYGSEALAPISVIVSAQFLIWMGVSALPVDQPQIAEDVGVEKVRPRAKVLNVVKTVAGRPIILSIVAGFAWRFGGLAIPGPLEVIIDRIAEISVTLMLLSLGLSLRKHRFGSNASAAILLAVFKLLAMPAIVLFLVVFLVPLPPVWAKVAVIAAACPTNNAAYVLASRIANGEALASNTIVVTTLLSIVSMTVWLEVAEWWL